jgi:hypothetical protein
MLAGMTGVTAMRPPAPTMPVVAVEEDETTELRPTPRLARDPSLPDTRVSPLDDQTVTRHRIQETLDDVAMLEELTSGIVPAKAAPADVRVGVRSDTVVRDAPHEITRIDGPRLHAVSSLPAPTLRSPPPLYLPLAHAATLLASPSAVVHAAPPVPEAHPAPAGMMSAISYAPTMPYAPPMPYALVPATSPTAHTARRRPAKRRGSLIATFACGVLATAMAVIALAESPVGTRPELAPYATVVRREARGGARSVATVATAGWARARALVKHPASV